MTTDKSPLKRGGRLVNNLDHHESTLVPHYTDSSMADWSYCSIGFWYPDKTNWEIAEYAINEVLKSQNAAQAQGQGTRGIFKFDSKFGLDRIYEHPCRTLVGRLNIWYGGGMHKEAALNRLVELLAPSWQAFQPILATKSLGDINKLDVHVCAGCRIRIFDYTSVPQKTMTMALQNVQLSELNGSLGTTHGKVRTIQPPQVDRSNLYSIWMYAGRRPLDEYEEELKQNFGEYMRRYGVPNVQLLDGNVLVGGTTLGFKITAPESRAATGAMSSRTAAGRTPNPKGVRFSALPTS